MASIKIKFSPSTPVAYLNDKDRMPKAFVAGELTEQEFVNAIFSPAEQINEAQVALLNAAMELAMGVSAQAHVGTGGGGSTSDSPWMDKRKDSETRKRR
ncbi:hypothetical protein E5358_12850 [Palleniella muris]|uniref:Uncharacterized protein n=1 Tax=Palleniella muris TaxID=3038145 RepID=A0AC61QNT8_9BACT|nr:hypothetical protein [Palleniella muris]TGX80536.1 hypothetical protein E5358_12850 [Palleniella muris]